MSAEQPPTPLQKLLTERGLLILIGLAVLGLVMIAIFGILLLRSLNGDADTAVTNGTPTPIPLPVGGTAVAAAAALVVGISESSTVTVTLDAPVSLQLGNRTYPVQTQVLAADGLWSAAGVGEGTAVWVYGSIINYLIGLPLSDVNRTLLEQLTPGQQIVLTTRSGSLLTFTFDTRQVIPANSRDYFAQTAPGLTIALLQDESSDRLVIHGSYVAPEVTDSLARNAFELGETAQLNDVQLTVSSATYLTDRPEAPPGFTFFLVDYQLQNVGLTAFDTSHLQLSLADELGNQYALSPVGSQLGTHRPLSGFLNAGQLTDATIGFQLPIGLRSPALNLLASRSDSSEQIVVTIPFPGGTQASSQATVVLQSVEVSGDRTSLILTGQITNLGEQQVVASEAEISLRTPDGAAYLLLATNPPFPWVVSPGQAVTFVVTYQRPLTADTAVFTVLQQPFQLSGLR